MPDVIACGELLIDFVSTVSGVALREAPAFQKAAGGAPANVAVGLARLGLSSGFIGMVGDDDFGHGLADELSENDVDVSRLRYSQEARTALAFVSLRADGERDFMFYRHPSADMLYAPKDVDADYIKTARVFQFGSITLGAPRSRAATLYALEMATEGGLFVSYDPNLRLNLWPSSEAARAGMLEGWPHANLIKVSEEELEFLSGDSGISQGAKAMWHDKLHVLLVTKGDGGATFFTHDGSGSEPGFSVNAVDTTGAGDGFLAGVLYSLFPHLDKPLQSDIVSDAVRFGNAVGALTTTKRGAIPALPTLESVQELLG